MKSSAHLKGLGLTGLGVLILSPDSLLIRLVHTDPITLLFWRSFLSALTLLLFFICWKKKQWFQAFLDVGKLGLLSAFLSASSNILFVFSITQTQAANTLICISITPLLSLLLSRFFLKETAPLRTWFAIGLCFLGIFIVFSGSLAQGKYLGDLLGLATAGCMAGNFVLVRHVRPRNMIPCLPIGGIFTALILLPFAHPLSLATPDAFFMAILGLFVLPVSFALITLGPRYLHAAEVSLLMLLETVLGPIWVWLFVQEVPTAQTLWGGSLVLATLILHTLFGTYIASQKNIPNP